MEDFDLILALNSAQIQVRVHPHAEGETTNYDVLFEGYTLTIYNHYNTFNNELTDGRLV